MPLDALDEGSVLADLKALGAQGHMLVQLDIAADGGRLTDDDTGAVIDEKRIPDLSAGMDVDPGQAVGILRHHARQKGYPVNVQHMRQTVGADGLEGRIAEDDLVHAFCRGIPLIGGDKVGLELASDLRKVLKQRGKDRLERRGGWNMRKAVLQDPGSLQQARLARGAVKGETGEERVDHQVGEALGLQAKPAGVRGRRFQRGIQFFKSAGDLPRHDR